MAITKFTTSGVNNIVKYNDFLAGNAAYDPGGYWPIASVTVGSAGSTTVDITSIPGTYKHLQVRAIIKTAAAGDGIRVRFNSDSGSNYAYHLLYGTGSTVGATGGASQTIATIADATYSGTNADTFSATIIDILDYASTSKYKTVRSLAGYDLNGSGEVRVSSALWMSTSAITSMTFYNGGGAGDFQNKTQFELYGIKEV